MITVYRQFGRRYHVTISRKKGLFKRETEALGDFPILSRALQFVGTYVVLHLHPDWGGNALSVQGPPPLWMTGVPFSELTPPDGIPGPLYVKLEDTAWRKLLKKLVKDAKASLKDPRRNDWSNKQVESLLVDCHYAGLAKQKSSLDDLWRRSQADTARP